jgi:hypothetical protein
MVLAVVSTLAFAGCSGVGRMYFYSPTSPPAETVRRPSIDRAEQITGPDNSIILQMGDFELEVWVRTYSALAWLVGPIYVPVVPIFPLVWPFRHRLEDENLHVRFCVRRSAGDVTILPIRTIVRLDDGEAIAPVQVSYSGNPEVTAVLRLQERSPCYGLEYPTRNMEFERFTLNLGEVTDAGVGIVVPAIVFDKAHGTIFQIWP